MTHARQITQLVTWPERNRAAALDMISWAEGTLDEPDPYRVVYGKGHVLQDLSDHPAITGEWRGKVLPARYCNAAGLKPGCKSTAAGAYQFTKPTWLDMQRSLGLPDFGPESQDRAAWGLITLLGAARLLEHGEVERALPLLSKRWASIPGSTSKQPQRRTTALLNAFVRAGGRLSIDP